MSARRPRAFVLVQVLIVIACLLALMAMLVADQRVSMRKTQDTLRERRAQLAAESAVAMAIATLEDATTDKVTLDDDWATLGDTGAEEYTLGTSSYRLEIVDAGSLVDVNYATSAQLDLMPVDEEMRDSLLDWRESGTTERTYGAKDSYYNALDPPYNARLGNLPVLSELLLVRGWTAQRLYDTTDQELRSSVSLEDDDGNDIPLATILTAESGCPNTQSDGTTRINIGSGTLDASVFMQFGIAPPIAQILARSGPYNSFSELLVMPGINTTIAQSLMNSVTFTNSTRLHGKVNLNTVKRSVLLTLPNVTTDIADSIISQQSTGFSSLGDLANLSGISMSTLANIADYFTISGDTFVIRAYGKSGGLGVALEVTVRKDSDRVRVVTWERVGGSGVPAWWCWDENATNTTTIGVQ